MPLLPKGGPTKRWCRLRNSVMRWFAAFFLLWATASWAQLAIEGPQPTYNGQNVAAVDLVANPHRDIEPLRPLIEQKAGATARCRDAGWRRDQRRRHFARCRSAAAPRWRVAPSWLLPIIKRMRRTIA